MGSANQAAPIPRRLFAFQDATILSSEKAAIQLVMFGPVTGGRHSKDTISFHRFRLATRSREPSPPVIRDSDGIRDFIPNVRRKPSKRNQC
jgi:hypothetical protein